MAGTLGLVSRAGKFSLATAGTVWLAKAIQRAISLIPTTDFGYLLTLTKRLLGPPYIYIFFNLILLCMLSASFWASSFNSILKKLQSFNFQPSIGSPTTPHDQVFIAFLTRQTSSFFNNIWHQNLGHQLDDAFLAEMKQTATVTIEEQVTVARFNQTVPFHDHPPPAGTFTIGNYAKSPDDGEWDTRSSKYDEKSTGGSAEVKIVNDDSQLEYDIGCEDEGLDMESTWKAIMEGKNKAMEKELKKSNTWDVPPKAVHQIERAAPNNSRGENKGRDVPKPVVNKCSTFKEREEEVGKRSIGKRGWGKMEVLMNQDDLYNRAETFINKFKNNIQLQRLESYQRFLEMINR